MISSLPKDCRSAIRLLFGEELCYLINIYKRCHCDFNVALEYKSEDVAEEEGSMNLVEGCSYPI